MSRAVLADRMGGELYHQFMDRGFRRSGRLLYQPVCSGCRECVPVRVVVERFEPGKSQRRCWRRNSDLAITIGEAIATDEKHALYARYLAGWHGRSDEGHEAFESFLYDSPVDTIEFQYRDPTSRLVAIGICDVCSRSLSSVYFYFDPADAARSLGTFGALVELETAAKLGVPHYYLGYWIRDCRTMRYKTSFRPFELLDPDGTWREPAGEAASGALNAECRAAENFRAH